MSSPPAASPTPLQFFVFLIESPSPNNFYHGRSEGELIRRAVELNAIPCVSKTVLNRAYFEEALRTGLREQIQKMEYHLPIIHISAHGNSKGIQLSDGDVITWKELSAYLLPVNATLDGKLLLAMSCCEGYSANRMAMVGNEKDVPFFGLFGSRKTPKWSETAIGFATLYHHLAREAHLSKAVTAMNVASGHDFELVWGQNVRDDFMNMIKRMIEDQKVKNIIERVEQITTTSQNSSGEANA